MKKILSFILVLIFAIGACQICVSADEAAVGNVYSEWRAQAGSISEFDGGLFQLNAYDSTKDKSSTNPMGARQAIWEGSLEEGKFSVTFDIASIFAGRGDKNADGTQKSGANDTAIIFGGSGVKASSKTTVNDIEKDSSYYALMFSNDSLRIALVDKAWKGNATTYPEAKPINVSVNLKTELGASWDGIKASGKVTLSVEYTKTGAVKVYVQGNHIEKLDRAEGVCVPFGGDIGVRAGMGYHVPTKIYNVSVEKKDDGASDNTPAVVEGWSAKLGTISPIDDGVFQINAFDISAPASVSNVKGQRQAMWDGSIEAGKVSVTFDLASINAGRGDKNEDGTQKAGANDTAIIFGGRGIAEATGNTINAVENASCYYVVMFTGENLRIARVQNGWQGTADKFPAAIKDISLKTQLGDDWTTAKADGKVKLTVEFTADGAVKVFVDDLHISAMDRAAGSCVPYGGEFGVRVGNGFHVPTKIYEVEVVPAEDNTDDGNTEGEGGNTEGGNTDNENTGNENENTGNENENTGNENENTGNTPDDDTDDSLAPNVGGNDSSSSNIGGANEPTDVKVKMDITVIIIIAGAALIAIGVALAIVLGKKKKA